MKRLTTDEINHGGTKGHRGFPFDDFSVFLRSAVVKNRAEPGRNQEGEMKRFTTEEINHGETKEHRGFPFDDFSVFLRSSVVKNRGEQKGNS